MGRVAVLEYDEDEQPAFAGRGYTLGHYLAAKNIPLDFLEMFLPCTRYRRGSAFMEIPFPNERGEINARRERHAASGEGHTVWAAGSQPQLYGQHGLPRIRDRGFAIIARSESDVHALWSFYDRVALALPRDTSWQDDRDAPQLEGVRTLGVTAWPDDPASKRLLNALHKSPLAPRVKVILFPPGEDWSSLYLDDPDNFTDNLLKRTKAAKPLADCLTVARADEITPLANMKRAPRARQVEGVLSVGAFAVAFGPPASLKSFLVFDLALAVASGGEWLGHKTEQGGSLILAAEGVEGIPDRGAAGVTARGLSDPGPLNILSGALDLRSPDETKKLIAKIKKLVPQPSLIVVDPLARYFGGGDENSGSHMGAVIANCAQVQAATGATLLLVHHTGKNEARGLRGHSSLLAAVDTALEIERRGMGGVMRVVKQKDGADGIELGFVVRPVGASLAVAPGTPAAARASFIRLHPLQEKILKALTKAAGKSRKLSYVAAFDAACRAMPEKSPGHQRQAFDRALAALADKRLVRIEGEQIEISETGEA